MRRIFLLFSLVLILSGCQNKVSPTNTLLPSPGNAQSLPQFVTDIETLAQTFSQTVEVADASSTEELPQVIRQLEAIQSDVQGLSAPPSALEAKAALYSYMYSKIQCYFNRLVPLPSPTRGYQKKNLCSLSASKLDYFHQKLNELKE